MDDWQDWIGGGRTTTAFLDPEQANRMAVTLDRDPDFKAGDTLPPAWHWLYFHDLVRATSLGTDGHPALGVTMPPVPLPRRMWAGGELTFHAPLPLGTTATRTTTIRSVTEKQGRTGRLYFVTVDHDIQVAGATAVSETQTIVYRELPMGPAVIDGQPAPTDAEFSRTWHLDSTALFRYSALTFNGHRIHYDADYCRTVEGYPDLVIHGPLLATLLLDLAAEQALPLGSFSSVSSFRYKARSPLFLPDAFTVNGRRDGRRTTLWAASPDRRPAMEAEALDRKSTPDA
ncbi:MaoC family dehydratase N-terminal domain-containing protein [Streptomyces sp. NPDC046909]|uniref:FAS1-like dehydratase domain-containing protein n=1 Tax=Streptomyces sp. NPDC046909 TaxID=3155617 RepID=UPI0033ED5D6C